MTALGMTALHLRMADLKFTHNFIICDRLSDTGIIFGIDAQKKFSLSYVWDKEKNSYIQKDGCARAQSISQHVDAGQLNVPPQQRPITLSLTKVMLD